MPVGLYLLHLIHLAYRLGRVLVDELKYVIEYSRYQSHLELVSSPHLIVAEMAPNDPYLFDLS